MSSSGLGDGSCRGGGGSLGPLFEPGLGVDDISRYLKR